MTAAGFARRVASVRQFNRFYPQKIGVLEEGLLHSPFTLAEARVLYELAHREAPTAGEIARELRLDPGYLSRILRGFRRQGLIELTPAARDGRRRHLALTAAGRAAFAPLDARSRKQVGELLRGLPEPAQGRLVDAMHTIERLLAPADATRENCRLRPHRPGDIGWIVSRHGALYAAEYGWDERFEAMVAEIVARFIERFDPCRERCWIAERGGEPLGSVALVRETPEVARLRLLLVEPSARGVGVGSRLIDACIRFARRAGYCKITLSTYSVLVAARSLYEAAGFRLGEARAEHRFGHDLIAEEWHLAL